MATKLTKIEAYRLAQIIAENFDPVLLLAMAIEKPQTPAQIAKAILPFFRGDTLRDKVAWAVSKCRPAFDSEDRFRLVVSSLLSKLKLKSAAPADLSAKLRAAMVTPMFVYRDAALVRSQAAALKAAGYNAVASLVDLQTGDGQRDYVVKGRSATKLTDAATANIQAVIEYGLTPVVIIRNDWAVRRKAGSVPSIGGQPDSPADFYSATRLRYEREFLDSLAPFYDRIHIQLSIEPEDPVSADFALQLARHLRAAGFTNRIFINPYASAIPAHESIRAALDSERVEWARSHHGENTPPDPVWNTDGDTAGNGSNVRTRVQLMEASGKGWILWTQSLANCPGDIPAEYLDVGLAAAAAPDTNLTGAERGFLWKPVSDEKKLVVLLPAAFTSRTSTSGAIYAGSQKLEAARYTGVANGGREHYRFAMPGASYPAGVEFRISDVSGSTWAWTINKPAARCTDLAARRIT